MNWQLQNLPCMPWLCCCLRISVPYLLIALQTYNFYTYKFNLQSKESSVASCMQKLRENGAGPVSVHTNGHWSWRTPCRVIQDLHAVSTQIKLCTALKKKQESLDSSGTHKIGKNVPSVWRRKLHFGDCDPDSSPRLVMSIIVHEAAPEHTQHKIKGIKFLA